jgi:hypothetical protein
MSTGKKHTEVVGITALAAHLGITRETVGRDAPNALNGAR